MGPASDSFRLLEALVLITVLVGFLGLLGRRNLFLRALALDVMGTGSVALFVLLAARSGLRTPIVEGGGSLDGAAVFGGMATDRLITELSRHAWADPIPQAVILTAIVIGLSIQALVLVVLTRLSRHDPLLDTASFEDLDDPLHQEG